jgi:hypothetical protein
MILKINNTRKIGQSPITPQTTVFSMARYSGRSSIVQMGPKECGGRVVIFMLVIYL